MKSGDRMNKYFFSLTKERLVGGLIPELHDDTNIVISSSADFARVYKIFYSKLYATLVSLSNRRKFVRNC
jgi:hypothetical protein